jgi:hypothetical protein
MQAYLQLRFLITKYCLLKAPLPPRRVQDVNIKSEQMTSEMISSRKGYPRVRNVASTRCPLCPRSIAARTTEVNRATSFYIILADSVFICSLS